jgi:protein gp37
MSDLFHEEVPVEFILKVFAVDLEVHRHPWQNSVPAGLGDGR